MDDLKTTLAKINKKHGEHTLSLANDVKHKSMERVSSGSLFFDYTLGKNKENIAGWPMGRIIELYGPESTGKSLISLYTIAEAQKQGFECLYIDCENAFDRGFAESLGVDTSKLIISTENRGGKVIDVACEVMRDYPKIRVIIFDSVASMIPEVELEASLEDQQMASMARIMSKGLRKIIFLNKNNALVIFINQLRENPGAGMYANPEYTPGGRAIKFYASIRADIRKGAGWIMDEKDKKKKIGQVVKFRITKNKTDIPLREGYFNFMYGEGIDRADELISLGLLKEAIGRKGAYYSVLDKTFQGKEDLAKALKEDKDFFEKVSKEVFAHEV